MTSDSFATGAMLVGKYRILQALGEGGMATVYAAEHTKLGHRVAIKVLREALARDANLVARFEREGRALSKLRSRNVVRVFDVDVLPSGAPFLVMEHLEGNDLETELHQRGPLPIGEAVGYALQACAAMQEAHSHGIIHRDLKPTNLFLAREGESRILKVLDFGIATDAPDMTDVRLTSTLSIMGTPLYMSPEQFRSAQEVDARTDVWALGATLYELLTGHPPFTGNLATLGAAVLTEPPRPMESYRSDLPEPLRALIFRTLEKDRARRVASMHEFADGLLPFSDGVVIAARGSSPSFHETRDMSAAATMLLAAPQPPASAPVEPVSTTTPGTAVAVTQTMPRPSTASRWGKGWMVAAALAAALAATALYRTTVGSKSAPQSALASAVGPTSVPIAEGPKTAAPPAATGTIAPPDSARVDLLPVASSPPSVVPHAAGEKGSGSRRGHAAPNSTTQPSKPVAPRTAAGNPPLFFPQ